MSGEASPMASLGSRSVMPRCGHCKRNLSVYEIRAHYGMVPTTTGTTDAPGRQKSDPSEPPDPTDGRRWNEFGESPRPTGKPYKKDY